MELLKLNLKKVLVHIDPRKLHNKKQKVKEKEEVVLKGLKKHVLLRKKLG